MSLVAAGGRASVGSGALQDIVRPEVSRIPPAFTTISADLEEATKRLKQHESNRRAEHKKGTAVIPLVMEFLGQIAPVTRNQLRAMYRPPTGPGQQPGLTASQEALFRTIAKSSPTGHLLLYSEYESQGCQCWSDDNLWNLRPGRVPIDLTNLASRCDGFWLTPNPFHGRLERILRKGKKDVSRRANACLTSVKITNLEADLVLDDFAGATRENLVDYALTLVSILPVSSLTATFTGGVSTHLIAPLPDWRPGTVAEQLADHKRWTNTHYVLRALGIDLGANLAVQLSPLPDVHRPEKTLPAELLALFPDGSGGALHPDRPFATMEALLAFCVDGILRHLPPVAEPKVTRTRKHIGPIANANRTAKLSAEKNYPSEKGKAGLRLLATARKQRGDAYVSTAEFAALVAGKVQLTPDDVSELFAKHPLGPERFWGPLKTARVGKVILPKDQAWKRQKTETLFATLAWCGQVLHDRIGVEPEELCTLLRWVSERPLCPASALRPPSGRSFPPHILLPGEPCPPGHWRHSVLATFSFLGKSDAELDALAQAGDLRAGKALRALGLQQEDSDIGDKLASLLDHAILLLESAPREEGGPINAWEWLEADINSWSELWHREVSDAHRQLVLDSIDELFFENGWAADHDFSRVDLDPIVARRRDAQKRCERRQVKNGERQGRPAQRKRRRISRGINRALNSLTKPGILVAAAGRRGQSTRYRLSEKAIADGVILLLRPPKKGGEKSETDKPCLTEQEKKEEKPRQPKSLRLGPGLCDEMPMVAGRWRKKEFQAEEQTFLVHAVQGFKSKKGGDMFSFEGFVPMDSKTDFGKWLGPESFRADRWVKAKLVLPQFACSTLALPANDGVVRPLGSDDCYAGVPFVLRVQAREEHDGAIFLNARPGLLDAAGLGCQDVEEVVLVPELRSIAGEDIVKARTAQGFARQRRAKNAAWFKNLDRAAAQGDPTQVAALLRHRFHRVAPEALAVAARSWKPGNPNTASVAALKALHRSAPAQEARQDSREMTGGLDAPLPP